MQVSSSQTEKFAQFSNLFGQNKKKCWLCKAVLHKCGHTIEGLVKAVTESVMNNIGKENQKVEKVKEW